ncbi:MAG: response regulator transcription factor [Candidatus Binatia bacterium]
MDDTASGQEATVFVVDDDVSARRSLGWLLESAGWAVDEFGSAEAFLQGYRHGRGGCALLDVRLPGISGLALQDEMIRRGITLPVIMLTGYSEVAIAVRALQRGAFDFFEKPFAEEQLQASVARAIELDADRRRRHAERAWVSSRVGRLTPREREVMSGVVAGKANKVVAYELGISQKTVESHRARLMQKLEVQTLAELVRLDWLAVQEERQLA